MIEQLRNPTKTSSKSTGHHQTNKDAHLGVAAKSLSLHQDFLSVFKYLRRREQRPGPAIFIFMLQTFKLTTNPRLHSSLNLFSNQKHFYHMI